MIVGLFLHKKSKGFLTSIDSKMYSSVARLNKISFDSDTKTSAALPLLVDSQLGQLEAPVDMSLADGLMIELASSLL